MKKETKPKSASQDFLLEIGTEELPATNLADFFDGSAEAGLENPWLSRFKKALEEHRLSAAEVFVWATPRRLVFFAKGVPPSQKAQANRIRLLSKEEAFADGKPTEKLSVILQHRGAKAQDVVVADWNGKPFAFLEKAEPVAKTPAVLPALCASLIQAPLFPKNMKWDDSGLTFARPIRSVACFYGMKPVPLRLGNLRAKPETAVFAKGRRTRLAVKDAASYFKALERAGVILDPASRKSAVREILEKLAKSSGGRLYDDPFLLNEVNFLVESPQGLAAPFGEEYLSLPLEVLAVSMARKQRLFGLVDGKGRVMPRFLAVLDGKAGEREKKIISTNMEHILHAKLKDSLFFWSEDLKVPLTKKREELKNLVFLKGAGSMFEKCERLERLADQFFGSDMNWPLEDLKALVRAAHLSKADLLTHMVGEFPELQGIMGKYYAKTQGENDAVSQAIGEQYLPRTASDKLPSTRIGAALSLLDKIDLIVACFKLGLEPSSSADPYGLRRSASAVVKIVLHHQFSFSMKQLLGRAMNALGISGERGELERRLVRFFNDRAQAVLVADRGFASGLVDAAVASQGDDYLNVLACAEKIHKILSKKEFVDAQKAVERTSNILKGAKETLPERVDPAHFSEPLEAALWKRFEEAEPAFRKAVEQGDFALATRLYADAFFAILGEFFEKVFINAEDPAVRKNRLALVRSIKELYTKNIADLSKIQVN